MRIETFRMERMQCTYENEVDYNLSESGVLPLKIDELLGPEEMEEFGSYSLKYAPANGSPELRENIAQWYPGATADHVTVVNGGAEANYMVLWSMLEKSERAALMLAGGATDKGAEDLGNGPESVHTWSALTG